MPLFLCIYYLPDEVVQAEKASAMLLQCFTLGA
jgi:hypothetical protein